jgi:divalent metal cation (Fe/Co/Zn/Cd) transporter
MNKKLREQLAGYVDGELPDDQREAFESELAVNPELQAELEEFRRLKKVTDMMHYADLPDEVWENYWQSLYRKLERGIGWIFLSVGAMVLLGFGLYEAFSELFTSPNNPLWLKIGVSGLSLGGVILLVSYARERLFAYKRDRYREVTK